MYKVSNNTVKFVASLSQKKYRDKEGCFVAEGNKCVRDTWDYFKCRMLIATQNWYENFGNYTHMDILQIATRQQMQKMSQFSNPSEVIAVYEIPEVTYTDSEVENNINIILEGVQDPGNLGTIIRLADWFGINNIFCNKQTVDVYNHKVIQATMGAISRVKVHYCDLEYLIESHPDMPVFGTTLDGENIYQASLPHKAFVIFGNEGNGMSEKLKQLTTRNLYIPSCAIDGATSESLNVGLAAAITISEFCRNTLK